MWGSDEFWIVLEEDLIWKSLSVSVGQALQWVFIKPGDCLWHKTLMIHPPAAIYFILAGVECEELLHALLQVQPIKELVKLNQGWELLYLEMC